MAGGQSTMEAGQPSLTTTVPKINPNPLQYSDLFKPKTLNDTLHSQIQSLPQIPMKPITFLHGVPYIKYTEVEVDQMNSIENLQYAVIGKFSYGQPDIEQLRFIIPEEPPDANNMGEGDTTSSSFW